MPRQRLYPAQEPTAVSRMLQEYMWGQRPPMTTGQLAYKLGTTHQTVYNWIARNTVPSPTALADIARVTGIPLADLYRAAGIPIPPPPKQYIAERQYTDNEKWDRMIEGTLATLRANGVTDEAILQAVVAQIRDVQYGTDRERHVAAEFAPPPEERTVPDLPAVPPSQPPQRAATTPRRTNSIAGEHQERRSPRRSSSGRVRSTSQ